LFTRPFDLCRKTDPFWRTCCSLGGGRGLETHDKKADGKAATKSPSRERVTSTGTKGRFILIENWITEDTTSEREFTRDGSCIATNFLRLL